LTRNIYIENTPLETAKTVFWNEIEKCGWFRLEAEIIDVTDALGRWVADPVLAKRSAPHYLASAMDGIAVKASATFPANESNPVTLPMADVLVVDTGDYIPPEYDAVIMIEDVNFIGDQAQIIKPAVPWQHVRSIGEDLVEQDMILPSHTRISPFEMASFKTSSVQKLRVIKKPIVAIIPTGTELVENGYDDMPPGEIVESNSLMLAGLVQEWGGDPRRHPIVVDDQSLIRQAVIEAEREADLIIVCSGSSAGREDYTAAIIGELGRLIVHGLATRPGKPAILGIINDKPVIGVPGYPVSAALIFSLFAKPLIFGRLGQEVLPDEQLECTISRKFPSHAGVDEFVHVNAAQVGNRFIAYPLSRGAGISSILVKSDGQICIPRGSEGLEAGTPCQVSLRRPSRIIANTLVHIGSHDLSIDFLIDILLKKSGLRMVSTNAGSMGGLMSLRRRETHCAGLHLLDYETGDYNRSYLDKYLPGEKIMLVNLVHRQQGLIVQPGNPMGIKGLEDLIRPEVRYINRQNGAGTRLLLDYLLGLKNIDPQSVNGYNREEYTHLAVAAAVKNNASDTGMAIYAGAKIMALDFIPIATERYDLCILPELLKKSQLDALLDAIRSRQFHDRVMAFGGYALDQSGQILLER